MRGALRRGERLGMERGMKQGIEQGIKQGIKQGIEQGIEQGILQTKQVFKLYIQGFSPEEIARQCNLPLEEVEEILG